MFKVETGSVSQGGNIKNERVKSMHDFSYSIQYPPHKKGLKDRMDRFV